MPVPVPTVEQCANATRRIKRELIDRMKSAYTGVQALIHANPHYTPEQMIAALGEDYAALQYDAVLLKTMLNHAMPGTIVDAVPEATITMPGS